MQAVKRKPWVLSMLLIWWLQGRAILKRRVAEAASISMDRIPYRQEVLDWLLARRAEGRELFWSPRCDPQLANGIADHVGIFFDVSTGNGRTEFDQHEQSRELLKIGQHGFDYVGLGTGNTSFFETCIQPPSST